VQPPPWMHPCVTVTKFALDLGSIYVYIPADFVLQEERNRKYFYRNWTTFYKLASHLTTYSGIVTVITPS
jgi:hypothetical protein